MLFRVLTFSMPCFLPFYEATAHSQSPWETELDFDSVIVATPISDEDGPDQVEPLLTEVALTGTRERVFENGVRFRAHGALRLQVDNPARPGGTGGFGGDTVAPIGAFSGLSSASTAESSAFRTRLESAYVQVDGGYGELRVGKDAGVGARFYEGARSVLSHARLDSSLLDPSGLSTVRTRHDLTGPSVKVSYATPRLLGLRGGVSFTPKAEADGLDRRPAGSTGGISPNMENAIELALNGTRRLRESGWRFDVGMAWSTADVTSDGLSAPYSSVETWSAGTRIEKDDWTLGASWLGSNNGLPDSDYSAWSAGLHRYAFNTDFSIEYGQSDDDGAVLNSESLRFGVGRDVTPSTDIAISLFRDKTKQLTNRSESTGVVVEITLSQEILRINGN